MKHGFLKVAAATPKIRVADPVYNSEQIVNEAVRAVANGAKVVAFPELCISGYTCADLFSQDSLLASCKECLGWIAKETAYLDAILFVGLPLEYLGKLYNVAAVLHTGKVLAFIPKKNIPNYGEFYEVRHFTEGTDYPVDVPFMGEEIPMGCKILIQDENMQELVIGCEICEDIWAPVSPSTTLATAGATLIVNLSASDETVGKDSYRRMLIQTTSAKLVCGYIYACAGEGESSQDLVFGGHNLICENGALLEEAARFQNEMIFADLDLGRIIHERRRMNTFRMDDDQLITVVTCKLLMEETALTRVFPQKPFVPGDDDLLGKRCDEILTIQSLGLKKRYEHTGCTQAVVGVSGGLDSTLALLVTVRAFDMLGLPRENIHAITMPCFGTTDRTLDNSVKLAKTLGATLKKINIKKSVTSHFKDIEQDIEVHDVTYENGQARERTQVLMDYANRVGGLVIGTGDLSELALGWATYNGDHMSMYGVNAGVPKTLIRHLVRYFADTCGDEKLQSVLLDVLDTPVSPELLPPVDGQIAQKTEDLVGPYELHDFFLYYVLRLGYSPEKVYRVAKHAFKRTYTKETILKWLKTFYRRFFSQQFKRSCLPDGPKVGSVSVSPRGDLRMPSDACVRIWMDEAEKLKA